MAHFQKLTAEKIAKLKKDEDLRWIDLRFTDPKGKWQHLTMDAENLDDDMLEDGIMFDGSLIAGWKDINDSDMTLKPDLSTGGIDTFSAQPSLYLISYILDSCPGRA